nr:hypothetical protein [Tanacetum cinerariifolium]
NARSSVLVNGSPTAEFELFRGLRQGDPLSQFLFILATKGLHALTCKAGELGLFTGATFGRDNMSISHLMLKINVHKSNVLGVCVSDEEVSDMENVIGCGVTKLPFKYIGVPVGSNMARVPIHEWSAILMRHPRGGFESSQLEALHAAIGNVVLTDQHDSWTWSLIYVKSYIIFLSKLSQI